MNITDPKLLIDLLSRAMKVGQLTFSIGGGISDEDAIKQVLSADDDSLGWWGCARKMYDALEPMHFDPPLPKQTVTEPIVLRTPQSKEQSKEPESGSVAASDDEVAIAAARAYWNGDDHWDRTGSYVKVSWYRVVRAVRAFGTQPVPMLLWCPECGARHIDRGAFSTKVHHTHSCQNCGHTWRPAVVATFGVQFLPGFKDESK